MSKKVVSLVAIWFCLSTLVQAASPPLPERPPTTTASPAASQLKVELLGHWPASNVLDLSVRGDRAFVASNSGGEPVTGKVHVLDVSKATNPKELDPPQRIEAGFDNVVYATGADDAYIYVAQDLPEGGDSQLWAHRRDDLQWVCWRPFTASRVVEMWASGGYWFAARDSGWLDVMEPAVGLYTQCSRVSSYQAPGEVSAAAYTANYAYLGTVDGRLLVVDISDPKKPTERSRRQLLPGGIVDMAAAPGVVYLAQGSTIKIVDVSNALSPAERKTFTNPEAVNQMGAAGGYLYAASEKGVHVFDVRDSNAPSLAGYYLDPADDGFGSALFLANDLVYSGGPGGMNILRFTPGTQPQDALLVQPAGPGGVRLDGELLPYPCELRPPGQDAKTPMDLRSCPECKENGKLHWVAKIRHNPVYMYLACFIHHVLFFSKLMKIEIEGPAAEEGSLILLVIGAHQRCDEVIPSKALGPASQALVLAHESGALRYTFLQEALTTEVKTDTVAIRSAGANTLAVHHDPLGNRSTVRCYSGSLTLTPANASLPPFTLPAGKEVEVTEESVGSITAIRYSVFLPLTVRNTSPSPAGGWTTLLREGFEGAFPGPWSVADGGTGLGEHHWGSRTCRPQGGGQSAWAVGGGADGAALACGSNYPGSVESWMWAGPFDLSDATAAEVSFQRWVNGDPSDRLSFGASADGASYQLIQDTGSAGAWQEVVYDLANAPALGDLTGNPDVWFAFVYSSDTSGSRPEGAYVDDILLRKYVPAAGVSHSAPVPGVRRAGPQAAEGLSPARWVRPGSGDKP